MVQRTSNHVLGVLLHHAICIFLAGARHIVRIRCNCIAISTADCRFFQRFIWHAASSIQGIFFWNDRYKLRCKQKHCSNCTRFGIARYTNRIVYCDVTDNTQIHMLIKFLPPVPVSRIVFRLLHAHNDRHIYLCDKENANVVDLTKTARWTLCSRLQVILTEQRDVLRSEHF